MAETHKVEQLSEQSTTSSSFVDISGTTLTFTPDSTSDIWVVFASGVCRSSSTSEQSFEMRLVINGSEHDLWSHQCSSSTNPNGAGFLVFDRVTGTTALQTVKLQFRQLAGTVYASDMRVVAARMPSGADFQYYDSDGIVGTTGSSVTIGSHTFTPTSSGNYYVFGKVSHREYPGGSTSQAWFEKSGGTKHPDAPTGTYYSCARDSWNPSTCVWRESLTASSTTFNIKFTSSGTGASESEHRYRKLMMFREDAFDDAGYDLSAAQTTTTSESFQTKNSVSVPAPPGEREFLTIQTARISGNTTSSTSRKSGELRAGGSALVRTDHRISRDGSSSQGYHHTVGVADVRSETGAVTYANGYLSPSEEVTIQCAESAIVVLRYPSAVAPGNSPFFGMVA